MRDELFSYFVDLGHRLNYYRAYAISARRISNVYSGFLLLASAGGIVTLSCWDRYPTLFAFIIFVAQVLQALKPLTQAAKQHQAARYIIHDLETLFDDVQCYWDLVASYDPPKDSPDVISDKIRAFKAREKGSIDLFSNGIDFPFKKRLDRKASEDTQRFFWYYYHVKKEEEF